MHEWYYVLNGDRHGPVSEDELKGLISNKTLGDEDYVWRKGFDNWEKLKSVEELQVEVVEPEIAPMPVSQESVQEEVQIVNQAQKEQAEEPLESAYRNEKPKFILKNLDPNANNIFIRIGTDRGQNQAVDYGPYNISIIKNLYQEKRINAQTLTFILGMDNWMELAEAEDFAEFFGEEPPVVERIEKRKQERKPFVARLFFANSNKVYEGICRDISVGGMQVLVKEYPGKPNDVISINVHPDNSDHQFVAEGVIVRILDGNQGFSFRFNNLSDDAKTSIESYLAN